MSNRDVDGGLALFADDPDVFLVGTGAYEVRLGISAIREQIRARPWPGGFGCMDIWSTEHFGCRRRCMDFRALSKKGNTFRVVFTSDSRYLIDGMTDWVHSWVARGWRRKAGPVENKELWQEAIDAVNGHAVHWRWVRGHAGHPQNEYANELATKAARELSTSHGAIPSAFDVWLAAQRAAGRMALEPDPLPTRFASHRALPR
jgi:ribonuclease HI